ncbi:MAG: hypothetical protein ABWZ67_14585 [Solirubrobacteraceae bacterium]
MPFALTAYEAGRSVGTIALAVLFVLLVLRAFDVLPRKKPTPHGKLTDLGVAAILGVLLIVTFFNGRADAWDGDEGRQMKAGFIAGCQSSAGSVLDCECVFAELTSEAPYDTPEGFAQLKEPVQQATESGDVSQIPAAYFSAVQDCAV